MRGTAIQKKYRMIKTDEGLIRSCGQGEILFSCSRPARDKKTALKELEHALAHFALNENLSSFSEGSVIFLVINRAPSGVMTAKRNSLVEEGSALYVTTSSFLPGFCPSSGIEPGIPARVIPLTPFRIGVTVASMVLTWTKADLPSPSSEINTGLKFWGTAFWRMTLGFTL